MELEVFERLEQRVEEAVGLIRRLREANAALQKSEDGLQSTVALLEEQNESLRNELSKQREDNIPRAEFEQRKKHLEARMGELLVRLDELDAGQSSQAKA